MSDTAYPQVFAASRFVADGRLVWDDKSDQVVAECPYDDFAQATARLMNEGEAARRAGMIAPESPAPTAPEDADDE